MVANKQVRLHADIVVSYTKVRCIVQRNRHTSTAAELTDDLMKCTSKRDAVLLKEIAHRLGSVKRSKMCWGNVKKKSDNMVRMLRKCIGKVGVEDNSKATPQWI